MKKIRMKNWLTMGMSLVMAAALCLTSVPISVSAASTVDTNSFVIEDGVLKEYIGIKSVVNIPEGVKEIEKRAFQFNKSIEKVNFPTTLCNIGTQAFQGCSNLTTVKMSYRIKNIENAAFSECTNLQSVDMSMTKLEVLQNRAFEDCTSLTEVTLPESIKVIGSHAFSGCKYLGSANLPEGLTTIQLNAFSNCESLTAVELPDTLNFLGNGAFASCDGLESIRIPAGITTLQESVFAGDHNLNKVYLPDTLRVIQSNALATKDGALEVPGSLSSLYIPESVEYIYHARGASSFGLNKASGIDEIQAKSGSYGESYAKYLSGSDSGLGPVLDISGEKDKTVEFTPVEENATICFDACGGKLAAGESQKAGIMGQMYGKLPTPVLKGYTFLGWYRDTGLKKRAKTTTLITQEETTLYAKWEKEVAREEVYQGLSSDFIIENGVLKEYTGKEPVVIVPDGVTEIKAGAFDGKSFIRKIVLPDSITTIGAVAFRSCSNLTQLNIPSGVTVIPSRMCQYCYSLESIIIPEGVTEIGDNAFTGVIKSGYHYYSALAHVELPDSLVRIGDAAFSECGNLLDLRLPDGLQEIGKNAFNNTALRKISIPDGVKTLSNGMFNGATGLKELRLENGLETIEKGFIGGNECLKRLYIPETVTTIEEAALDDNLPSGKITIVGVKTGGAYDYYESLKNNSDYSDIDITFEALSEEQLVKISFDTGVDGLQLAEREAYVGLPFGSLPRPAQNGKTFVGWSLTSDESGLIADTDIIRQEDTGKENSIQTMTLTAVWKDAEEEKPEGTPVIPETGDDTEDTEVVEIDTLEKLSAIRQNLHGHYKLTADIDASEAADGYGFCPIGAVEGSENASDEYSEKAFDGVLDGNGHTISGLTIQGDTPYVGVGLFARVEGGVVKNLNLKDVKIEAGSSARRVGAVAGLVDSEESTGVQGCIENVTVSGEVGMVTGQKIKTQLAILGGAVGYVGNAKVLNIKNRAAVSYWSKEEEQPEGACSRFVGGVAGYLSGGKLYQCSNTGAVTVYRDYYGEFSGTSPESMWDVSGMLGLALSGKNVNLYVGGILGYAVSWETRGMIEQCYNTGDVMAVMNNRKDLSLNITSHSNVYTGGITGYIYSNTGVVNCYNKGDVIGRSMSNTSLLGADAANADALRQYLDANTVSAFTNAYAYAAGIVGSAGESASGPIKYCYNIGKISASEDKVYGIVNGDIPIAYSRYAAMTITKDEKEVALTGSSRTETISTCQSLEADELALTESYRGFGFGREWILAENSGMKSPMLLGNMEEEIISARFVTDDSKPIQTEYAYGEELDLTGLQLELQMEGIEEPVVIDVAGDMGTGYDPYQEGEQILTISCAGQSMELTVFVNAPLYELTVTNGSGDGYYQEGTEITIQAEDIAEDKRFLKWVVVGGEVEIDQPDCATATVTLGAGDSSIVAEYEQLYEVKVTNGKGSGFYGVGDTVTVTADEPQEGYVFSKWVGKLCNNGPATLEHPEDATMTFVIPENPRLYPLTLTAKYVKGSNPEVTPSATPGVPPTGTPAVSPSVPPEGTPAATPSAPATGTPTATPSVGPTGAPVASPSVPPTGTPSEGTQNPVPSTVPGQSPTASPNHKSDAETTSSPEDDKDTESDETLRKNIVRDDKKIAMVRITDSEKKEAEYVKPYGKVKSTLVIPKTVTVNKTTYKVTSIANDAFKGNKKLTQITIVDNIRIIGDRAFMSCTKLKRVTLGNNVKKVGKKAFYGDKKLTKLTIQSTKLTRNSVGAKAFAKGNKELVVKVPKNRLKLYRKVLTVKGISKKATIK